MKGSTKAILITVGAIVLMILGLLFLGFDLPVISVSAEALPGFTIGPLQVTNSLLTSWVVILIIVVVSFVGTRNMKMVPSGLQNVLELIVETLYNLTEGVAGKKWVGRFFVIPVTIFVYVLVSNWFGLLPGLQGFGFCVEEHHEAEATEHVEELHAEEEAATGFGARLGTTCAEGEHIVPLFRSPSADLNNTFVLAVLTQIAAQVFGFVALGFLGYLGKFFVFGDLAAAFKPDAYGNRRSFGGMLGQLALGTITLFVGLLEGLSEFIKIIAFTFRLFGNIFAGEVMLIVITFLIPLVVTVPFLGFEVFVGLVQAFIFFILSVAFYTVAVTSHEHDESH